MENTKKTEEKKEKETTKEKLIVGEQSRPLAFIRESLSSDYCLSKL